MSKQPLLYEEKLPLSVHYQDLQASSMGHLFYTHGNQTPEFKKDNTLEKDMHTSKHYSSRWRAFEISQEHTVLRSKEKSNTLLPGELLILPSFSEGSRVILRKKTLSTKEMQNMNTNSFHKTD